MTAEPHPPNPVDSVLRARAETSLGLADTEALDFARLSIEDTRKLFHELSVHQVELEMQNEELRHAQNELGVLTDKYVDLYDFAPVGFMTIDLKGIIREANLNVAALLGKPRSALLATPFSRCVAREGHKEYYGALKRVAEAGAKRTCDLTLSRADGSVFDARLDLVGMTDEEGEPAGCRVAILDVTESKQAEQLMSERARYKTVADLAKGVAHNFNNILQITLGYADVSLADFEQGDVSHLKESLRAIIEVSGIGAETVGRLNEFSARCAPGPKPPLEIFDMAALVQHAIQLTEPMWKMQPEKRGRCVDLHADMKMGCFVRARKNDIFEVVVNLIKNAAEALSGGGAIMVRTYASAGWVVTQIHDTGVGLSEEDLSRLFNPFFTTKAEMGAGLGLALCRAMVDECGGVIDAVSGQGSGTTLTVRLPRAEPLATVDPQTAPAPSLANKRENAALSFIVVDDVRPIADLMVRGLRVAGHTACAAASGPEALALFEESPVSVIVCDLGMPGMNGRKTARAVRELCAKTGIPRPLFVILTGWGATPDDDALDLESGVDETIHKPIPAADLIQRIRSLLPG